MSGAAAQAQVPVAARLTRAIRLVCPAIVSVRIGDRLDRVTWRVLPDDQQSCAQPIIDAFDQDDPAHEQAELAAEVTAALDTERLTSAIVWTILKQMFPADTDAQTKTKYLAARTKMIDAYKSQAWKP